MPINIEINGDTVTVTRYREPRNRELNAKDRKAGATAVAEIVVIEYADNDDPDVRSYSNIVAL